MEKYNFHTHTFRCGHAVGDIPEIIEAAREAGYETLGFSEHTYLPDGRWASVRLKPEDAEGYFSLIRKHQALEQEKIDGMRILAGLECEPVKEYFSFYKELKEKYNLDYMIAGNHFFPYEGQIISAFDDRYDVQKKIKTYMQCIIDGIESGLFFYVAHPDMFMSSKERWDSYTEGAAKEMMAVAKAHHVPLEINLNGYKKGLVRVGLNLRYHYPFDAFWELAAKEGVDVVIGVDAHTPRSFSMQYPALDELLQKYDLHLLHQDAVLARLEGKKNV